MTYLKLKIILIFFILFACFCLPAAVTAEDTHSLRWLYERIDTHEAIEYNKKRLLYSKSEDEKKRIRKLLLKNYAKAIDSAEGERKEKLILEAKEYLPQWWAPYFLLAVMRYEKYKETLLHSDSKQPDTLISEACDFARSAKGKRGVPEKYITTCNMIIRDYQKTKPFTVYGMADNVRLNGVDLKADNREYLIESIPVEFIQQGLIKEGDVTEVVLKPQIALTKDNNGSHRQTIGGYDFLSLNKRRKPGYILTGNIIKKDAGAFVVVSDKKENIIVNISKNNYDFFNVGDTIKCRVFPNAHSYPSAGHLNLYEVDPEFYQAALAERKQKHIE